MAAIQIKNVPDDLRETLVQAAKAKGQSLETYLLDALTERAHLARNTELLRDS